MHKILITLIVFIFVSCSSHVPQAERSIATSTETILILGDSNLVGSFGDELHGAIQKWEEADVLSIAIGGGNPTYYNQTMINKCCGYKVRFSAKGGKIKILEKSGTKNNAKILPEYGSSVATILKQKKPSMIVIALGSNADALKNYSSLLKKMNDYDQDVPVYWIGPPNDKAINAAKADGNIQKALNSYPKNPYHFFSSQREIGRAHV